MQSENLPKARILVLVGNYGSGKTEISLNLALKLARRGEKVTLVDLDIVNPYFRSSERTELLEKEGVSLRVVKLNRVAPLDGDGICRALDGVKCVVAAEDQLRAGAVGERLGALLLERGAGIERYVLRNAGEALPAQGSTAQLRHVLGLDAEGMAQAVREVLK